MSVEYVGIDLSMCTKYKHNTTLSQESDGTVSQRDEETDKC